MTLRSVFYSVSFCFFDKLQPIIAQFQLVLFASWHKKEKKVKIIFENAVSICTVALHYTLKYYMHNSLFFFEKTAVHCALERYMHGSLFFSKKIAVLCILECYMQGSLFFFENTAGFYILECYMHGSSIQVVVFTTKELFRRNRIWQTRWPNKRISLTLSGRVARTAYHEKPSVFPGGRPGVTWHKIGFMWKMNRQHGNFFNESKIDRIRIVIVYSAP